MRELHIAIVIASMRAGGAERAMLNLANGFNAQGIRADLVGIVCDVSVARCIASRI